MTYLGGILRTNQFSLYSQGSLEEPSLMYSQIQKDMPSAYKPKKSMIAKQKANLYF